MGECSSGLSQRLADVRFVAKWILTAWSIWWIGLSKYKLDLRFRDPFPSHQVHVVPESSRIFPAFIPPSPNATVNNKLIHRGLRAKTRREFESHQVSRLCMEGKKCAR